MRTGRFAAVVFLAVLGGCQTTTRPIEAKLRADDAACQDYGFRYGSRNYMICRKQRDATFLQVNLGASGVMQGTDWTRPLLEPDDIMAPGRP